MARCAASEVYMQKIGIRAKILDLLLFALFYGIAYVIGYFAAFAIENVMLRLFVFDIIATVIIYLLSLTIQNSSLYDAYWSLTPFCMAVYLLVTNGGLNVWHYIVFAVFSLWSWRLTVNWVITFGGRKWVDWRYKRYQEKYGPFMWQIANFFGIMLMPTLLVFAGFAPLVFAFSAPLNALSLIGCAIVLFGTALEFFADRQMHGFLKRAAVGEVIDRGLWKYSRHPNYLGEISIWVGVYFALFPAVTDYWYMFGGAVLMVLLFNFISIPLAEKRQLSRRAGYAEYKKVTSRLLLLPPKKANKAERTK